MARASCTFRQRDVTAAVKAARAAGVARVEVDKAGKIIIIAKTEGERTADGNPWDEVLTDAAN